MKQMFLSCRQLAKCFEVTIYYYQLHWIDIAQNFAWKYTFQNHHYIVAIVSVMWLRSVEISVPVCVFSFNHEEFSPFLRGDRR